ncbi:hypothetical protein [Corynebacterium sp. AOP12-C2-36]|uniref:hypothetical protein n=1 Tax=Corynebacterium sp. AOP12-C2-36 TaxID=3457723 RepID=UPI00403483F0
MPAPDHLSTHAIAEIIYPTERVARLLTRRSERSTTSADEVRQAAAQMRQAWVDNYATECTPIPEREALPVSAIAASLISIRGQIQDAEQGLTDLQHAAVGQGLSIRAVATFSGVSHPTLSARLAKTSASDSARHVLARELRRRADQIEEGR